MPEKAWKRYERAVAAYLRGRRVPITGRQRGDAPDVAHEKFGIECKRRDLPAWILEGLEQARACSEGKTPLLVLAQKGRPVGESLAVLKLSDLRGIDNGLFGPQNDQGGG